MDENELHIPLFDFDTGEFVTDLDGAVVTVTRTEAVKMVIQKAMNTARSVYLIYADNEYEENHHVYGHEITDVMTRGELPEQTRISEIQRAIREALVYDPWIIDVYDIKINRLGTDEATADFWVSTIFDQPVQVQGVNLANGMAATL